MQQQVSNWFNKYVDKRKYPVLRKTKSTKSKFTGHSNTDTYNFYVIIFVNRMS